jgi:ribonuclease E
MIRRLLVNALDPGEVRVAVLDDGVLQEFQIERASRTTLVGNIYLGRVVNVVPSLQAAFVDLGLPRNAFLHATEVVAPGESRFPDPPPGDIPETAETDPGRRGPERHERRPALHIRDVVKAGDTLLVQVTRDPVGEKGPSVSMDLSIPGRYLVLTPQTRRFAVSKRITDPAEREGLKSVLAELEPPADVGFIIRTAGTGQTKRDLKRDLDDLVRLWGVVSDKREKERPPALLYEETDLALRTIRDLFTTDVEEVLIDSEDVFRRADEWVAAVMPRFRGRFHLYAEDEPLFHKFQVESQIDAIYRKRVELPSGGSIVIEGTEALTAVDVNSGRLVGDSPEEMAYRTNLEACVEIGRQLRLRDLGGVVVIDFIDVREGPHRREIEWALREAVKRDRSKTVILKMSRFGLVEMARQKIRSGVKLTSYGECGVCAGTGLVRSVESMGLVLMRAIRHEMTSGSGVALQVRMNPEVAQHLLNEKRKELMALEERYGREVMILGEGSFAMERFEVDRMG